MKTLAAFLSVLIPTAGCSSPWTTLAEKFATKEALPTDHRAPEAVNLTAAAGFYTYDGDLAYALTDQGFLLQFSGIRFDRGTVLLPAANIAACSRIVLPSRKYTALWLPEPGVEVAVADPDRFVSKWCEERGIAIVERATYVGTIRRR